MTRLLSITFAVACCGAAQAEDVKWESLCARSRNHVLSIETASGEKVTGLCQFQAGGKITIVTGKNATTIERGEITRARLERLRRTRTVDSVGIFGFATLFWGCGLLSSWEFALGPPLIAVGAATIVVGLPVAALVDLFHHLGGSVAITIV
jgi:hypothetical protein